MTHKNAVGWLGALLVVCLASGTPAHAQTLRYKFAKGDKLNYVVEQKMLMKMSIMGQNIEMNMTQQMDMSWNVTAVDATGGATVAQKFERIRFKMEGGPLGKIEYDSKEDKELEGPFGKLMGDLFKVLAGAEMTVTMNAQGEMSNVKLPEKFRQAVQNLPGVGGAGLDEMFSEEGLKRMVGQGALVLPKEPVAKGTSWSNKMEMKMPQVGTMKMDNTYTYEGQVDANGKKLEQISVKPVIKLEPDPNSPLTIKLKTGDAKGALRFDNTTGQLVDSHLNQTMEMEFSVMGQNFTQNIQQTVTMKLVDK